MRTTVLIVLLAATTGIAACDEIGALQKPKAIQVEFQAAVANQEPTGKLEWAGEEGTAEFRAAHQLPDKLAPGQKSGPIDLGPYLALRGPKGDQCNVQFQMLIIKIDTDPKTKKTSNSFDSYTFKQDICKNAVVVIALDEAHRLPKTEPVSMLSRLPKAAT